MKRVLVPFTTGVEEIELVAIVDILRRADVEVCMASLDDKAVTGRSKITLQADISLNDAQQQDWDMIVLPGGLPNADLLRESRTLQALAMKHAKQGKTVAAICAAPAALASFGLTQGKKVTSYPSFQQTILQYEPSSIYCADAVVEDEHIITSRGAGTAVAFALHLVQKLCGQNKAEEIRAAIVAPPYM